jgi:hemolysin III
MEQAFFDEEHLFVETAIGGLKHHDTIIHNDNRLFPTYPLYSEGLRRPKYRGYLHGIASVLLVVALGVLLHDCRHSPSGQIVSSLYIFTKLCCYGSSALYHIFSWSPKVEIFIQKMDHCGIAILSTGTMLPTSVFLLGPIYGTFLIGTSSILCLIVCTNIFRCKPSLLMQGLVAIWWLVPFWWPLYNLMTSLEFSCMISVVILKGIGVYVFANEYPDPFPDIFGYHEIFHVFVCIAGCCIFACNWSIIHRFCDDEHIKFPVINN